MIDILEAEKCGIAVVRGSYAMQALEKGNPHAVIHHPNELGNVIRAMED